LETETARPIGAGVFEVSAAGEFQMSREGKENATPTALEVGLTHRLELLVEPVFYTAIRPKKGLQATGPGDLETTLTYLVASERKLAPAVAVAGEVKFPTAHNTLIGTGKTDYTAYLMASKQFGRFDTHADLGYTIVGQPAGVKLNNLASFAVAVEYRVTQTLQVVSEVLGNTSALTETNDAIKGANESVVTPEASGGELVGTIGARYFLHSNIALCLGVSFDNSHAVLFAPGLLCRFH
jgi:hypothetical protein